MKLLLFAHRAEAWFFLKKKKFSSFPFSFDGLYGNENELLLVTGEGRQNCTERLSSICSAYRNKIDSVTNLGIAGALEDSIELGRIYQIRTCYAQEEFKSFTCAISDRKDLLDCISAKDRVLDREKASHLSCFASLADRECWAAGSVCSLLKIPFYCFKLASDRANSHNCLNIAKQGRKFSEQLYFFYEKFNYPLPSFPSSFCLGDDFYFTLSQKNHYRKLIKKLKIKWQKSEEEIILAMKIEDIRQKSHTPKKRTNLLIASLEEKLSCNQDFYV